MWYYEENGKSTGPAGDDEIQNLIMAGRITPFTRVWREGMIEWQPADRTDLAAAFPGHAPPPTYPAMPPAFDPAYIGDYRYAGFWIRFAAYIIDLIFLQIVALVSGGIIGVIFGIAGAVNKNAPDQALLQGAGGLVGLLVGILYYSIIPATSWQATPGKRVLRLHIIRTSGRQVGFWLALGRYLAYIVSSLIFLFGFFMIGWTREKTGLHDIMCGTRVVHGRPRVQNVALVFE